MRKYSSLNSVDNFLLIGTLLIKHAKVKLLLMSNNPNVDDFGIINRFSRIFHDQF